MKKIIGLLLIIMLVFVGYVSAADITVRWDPNTEDDLAGYKLYYKADTSGPEYLGTEADEGSSPINIPLDTQGFDPNNPEYTITNLDAAHVYFLVLTAYDDAGNESGYSNEVQTFYISSPQTDFYINSDNYTAFNVSGRGAAGYDVEVYANDIPVGEPTTPIADGSWSVDINFTNVDEGDVILSARTTVTTEEIISNAVTGILDTTAPLPPSPPAIPQNLSATVMSSTQINLSWGSVENATGYTVYRDDVNIGSINEPNYNNYDLEPSTTYEYEIAAYITIDNPSGRSELISATTQGNDGSPPPPDDGGSDDGCFISSSDTDKDLFIKAGTLYLAITAVLLGIVFGLIFLKQTIKRRFTGC